MCAEPWACQFPVREQLGLVLANVPGPKRSGDGGMSSELFDDADVTLCGSLRVITTLEFLQHHFS